MIVTINLTYINSSEVVSTVKTNTLLKNKSTTKNSSKSLLRNKSKLTFQKKNYSFSDPPGTVSTNDVTLNLNVKNALETAKVIDVPQNKKTTNPIQNPATKDATKDATKGKGDVLLNDWLMISSKGFSTHYNEIEMGFHGDNIKIKTDSFDYRVNDAFSKDTNTENQPLTEKLFWFRLTKDLIFYSSTKQDLNLLGGLRIHEIVQAESEKRGPDGDYCFEITDNINHNWQVCSEYEKVRNTWFCKIQELRKENLPHYCSSSTTDENIKIVIKNIVQPYIIIPIPSRHCNEDWNYQKHGDDWECDCSEGREQSPIDLPAKDKAIDSSAIPIFNFNKVEVSNVKSNDGVERYSENLQIKLEENNLRIKHDRFGKTVTPDGSVFYAKEIIIHTPAEHMINGKQYDMEVQIIHQGKSVGDIGKQIVLSFIFEKVAGVYNQFIDDLDFFNLPNPISPIVDINNSIYVPKILYNSDDKEEIHGMKHFSFYTYQGSLTSPPCTEDTVMYVNSSPIPIGTTALQMFQEALRIPDLIDGKGNVTVSDWIPISNRNIQALNGRPVFHYDHQKYCGPDKPKNNREKLGHFEKIKSVAEKYFYVSGKKLSGIPNAFLVSKDEAYNTQPHRP